MYLKITSVIFWLSLGLIHCEIGIQDEENLKSPLLKVTLFTVSLSQYELGDIIAPNSMQCCDTYKNAAEFCNELCDAEFHLFCEGESVTQFGSIKLTKGEFNVQMKVQVNDSRCFVSGKNKVSLLSSNKVELLNFALVSPKTNEHFQNIHSSAGSNSITLSIGKMCHPYMGEACDTLCLSYGPGYHCDFSTGKRGCRGNHKGKFCDQIENLCTANPCANGGTCRLDPFGSPVCDCTSFTYGQYCEYQVCNKTNCVYGTCNNGICQCQAGYTGVECAQQACTDTKCLNSGECSLDENSAICSCPRDSAYGSTCEYSCQGSCYGGSSCTKINENPACFCPFGIETSQCFTPIAKSVCYSLPCENGGECKQFSDVEAFCECPPAYTGKLCESNICSLSNCIKGSCMDGGFCSCIESYSGERCDRPTCIAGKSCLNDGVCVSSINGVSCDCKRNFTGSKCQFECAENCSEHGRCEVIHGQTKCVCDQFYSGPTCELNIEMSECKKLNCKNGGECRFAENKYQCLCSSQWTGTDCSISKCDDSNCQRGSCLDGIGCVCATTFLGQNCSIASCTGDYCNNQGICNVYGNTQTCQCLRAFYGNRCQYTCNPRCVHGQCYNDNGESKCRCDPKFFGETCEKENIIEFINMILLVVMIIIAVIVLLTFVTALLSNLVFKRQKRGDLFLKGTIQQGFEMTKVDNKDLNWGSLAR